MTKKKSTKPAARRTRMQADQSDYSGIVMPCPLCAHRVTTDDLHAAWRSLYNHLRHHHNEQHAAQYTQRARLQIAQMNWHSRQKQSHRAAD